MTLVEVLIVIALMAVVTGSVLGSSGLLAGTRLRGAATAIMAGIRLGLTHANSTGLPTRMVFDFEKGTVSLEESTSRMLRDVSEDVDDPSAGAEAATELERLARQEAAEDLAGPKEPPPRFAAFKAFSGETEADRLARPLGDGISFVSVQTEHDKEPRTEGRAYLYFWPGGGTEKAVVQLTRPGKEEPLSIVVSSLSGRAEIVRGAIDYEEPPEDVDFGEREAED